MNWVRDKYYVNNDGEKVRLIYTKAAGHSPLVFIDSAGDTYQTRLDGTVDGFGDSLDITGPWARPVKPIEMWLNVYSGYETHWNNEADARADAGPNALRIAVHMREVVP